MQDFPARRLVFFLTVTVWFLSACDVLILVTAPWWLKSMYVTNFAGLSVMLGYSYPMAGVIYPLMLAFFIVSGLLTLGVLIEALRILRRIRGGAAFCAGNAVSLRNAALCAFGLFAVFLAKMFFSPSILTLVCGGIFLLFGLFVLVMSQLVLEASRIREENELTI